ncbi:hypothetical protein [Agrobacterium sp. NPDC090283]|uniref:hypothetical protein n=1 Tax=Agrobacterium sp. NPDC090283 TaxID=3363920 RepID=UPI00383AE421
MDWSFSILRPAEWRAPVALYRGTGKLQNPEGAMTSGVRQRLSDMHLIAGKTEIRLPHLVALFCASLA